MRKQDTLAAEDAWDVKSSIRDSIESLSNGERKVARALLASYPSAGLTTVADLAAAAGVSPPTVVRFANRLGYKGFPDFQRALLVELNNELGSPLRQYEQKNSSQEGQALSTTGQSLIELVSTTYREIPESEFNRTVELLSSAKRPCIVTGGRFTRLSAEYLSTHLTMVRSRVAYLGTDDIMTRSLITDAGQQTVVVIYDVRRYSSRLEHLARAFKDKGVTLCLITDHWLSPISRFADVVIPVAVESVSPFDSIIGAMALSESLIAAVSHELGTSGAIRLEEFERTQLAP